MNTFIKTVTNIGVMEPNNKVSILTLFIAVVLGVAAMAWLDSGIEHNHKEYKIQWANKIKSTSFVVCGDTAVVRYNGTHIDYIPKHLQKIIDKEKEGK